MKEIKLNQLKTIITSCADEIETSINWCRRDEGVSIYTSDNVTVTKLKKVIEKNPSGWHIYETTNDEQGRPYGYIFKAPRKAISFRSGAEVQVSEERAEAARERFKKLAAEGKLGRNKK